MALIIYKHVPDERLITSELSRFWKAFDTLGSYLGMRSGFIGNANTKCDQEWMRMSLFHCCIRHVTTRALHPQLLRTDGTAPAGHILNFVTW